MDLTRRTALVLGVGALVAGSAAVAALSDEALDLRADVDRREAERAAAEKALADHPAVPTVVIADHTVPADAVWFHPTGDDAATGTRDHPRRTPLPGRFNVGEGWHAGASWEVPRGPRTTIASHGLVLDGGGTVASALVAAGVTDLLGDLVVQNYAPTATDNGSNAPVYFGGDSAGSLVDGLTIRSSTKAALGFQNRITLRNFTAEDIGYSAIMGSGADDTRLENITLRRVNRGGHTQDGQLGACKLTFSRRVVVRGFHLEDCPAGNGLWLDMGCQDADLADVHIAGAGANGTSTMRHGIHPEVTVGVRLRSFTVRGATSGGLMVLDSADVDAADGDLRGNFVGAWYEQDARVNTGTDPRDGTPAENPWRTRGNRLRNTLFDGPHQLWAYTSDAVATEIPGETFLEEVRGCGFLTGADPATQIRTGRNRYPSVAQLAAAKPGFGPNYRGSDPAGVVQVRQEIEA